MKRYPVKRPLLPDAPNKFFKPVNRVQVLPDLDNLFEDVESIIGVEYARLKQKMENGKELDTKDINSLTKCGELLLKLSKERRERDKVNQGENLSDEELLAQAEEAVKVLREKIEKKKLEGVKKDESTGYSES